jgi:hypothetical protein
MTLMTTGEKKLGAVFHMEFIFLNIAIVHIPFAAILLVTPLPDLKNAFLFLER